MKRRKSDRERFIEKAREKRDRSKKHRVKDPDPIAARIVTNADLRRACGYE